MNDPGQHMELKLTGDGSHTIYVPELDEHYHSTFGAVGESKHIFLEAGFHHARRQGEMLRILEIGFGTGLNAFLTLLESIKTGSMTEYHSIELFPLAKEIWTSLNYAEVVGGTESLTYLTSLHLADWGVGIQVTPWFRLKKIHSSIQDCLLQPDYYNLVYFDAFGPDKQPEMWTSEIFAKLYQALRPGGIMVTYSTKGQVKRNLKAAGFSIEKLPGPAGKREILRAEK